MSQEWIIKPRDERTLEIQLPDDITVAPNGTVRPEDLAEVLKRWVDAHAGERMATLCCALQQGDHFICSKI